ncbi:MAG: response regulator, partial [Victivallaceae bacterium]
AISNRLVNGMGGELLVDSTLGKVCCFTADFPEIRSRERIAELNTTSSEAGQHSWKVLIVDDIALNLRVLSAMLKKCGIDSITALSGGEAMDILEQEYPNITLVLTDLWMPGMSGFELAKKIRQDKKFDQMPIVAVSADVELKKSVGADIFSGIIYKPVALESLKKLFASLSL